MKNIFLSYSRQDLSFVEKLAEDLQQAGYDVWYDLTDLEGGARWADEIQAAIDKCDLFITVISPKSMDSEWVEKEFLYASNVKKRTLPLMREMSTLPLWLSNIHYIDIQGRNYKKNFPLITAAIEDNEPVLPPQPAWGLHFLSPAWIGGIAGGVILVLVAIFGLPALLGQSDPTPTESVTATTLASPPTFTLAPVTETSVPSPTSASGTATEAATEVVATATLLPVITDSKGTEMLLVPAGSFTMGSEAGSPDERPIHVVGMDAFYIDKFEVSTAQYKKCVDDLVCVLPTNTRLYTNSLFSDHPLVYVTWEMANTYCDWRGARLPTEAEWEKAARGSGLLNYPWGNQFDGKLLNFCDLNCTNSGANRTYNDGYDDTAPVGTFEGGKSPYGVYNMAGNVREWVADWYSRDYYSQSPNRNPTGPESGTYRVLRGGSWFDSLENVRTYSRTFLSPSTGYNYVGFRCASDAIP